jgi:mRNA interferase HigB
VRVNLIKQSTIIEYYQAQTGSKASFVKWLNMLKYADWKIPADIKNTYSSADLLGNGSNRVVFDIAGNSHRMICKYQFGDKNINLYVCWIGTHSSYTFICTKKQQYTINIYRKPLKI